MSMGKRVSPAAVARDQFRDLVQNAADFLERSVEELLVGDVKFSAVHFYQSVELFVKARLLIEHWSLVVTDPAKADRVKFERGDFQSVSLPQAVERLAAIVGDDIGNAAQAFEPVRKRRNRVIHFHASEYPPRPRSGHVAMRETGAELFSKATPEVAALVAEQCLAWYELHLLLTNRWKSHFAGYSVQIEWLNKKMLDVRPYLQARFDRLKPDIEKLSQSGLTITVCSACGFAANEDTAVFEGMTQSRCLVCLRHDRMFRFPCPMEECNGTMTVSECGGGECTECEHTMSVAELVHHFEQPYDPRDGEESSRAYCSECESFDASGTAEWLDDAERYVCFNCLSDSDTVTSCGWCGERMTGDVEDTYWRGCIICDGHAGHIRDKDD